MLLGMRYVTKVRGYSKSECWMKLSSMVLCKIWTNTLTSGGEVTLDYWTGLLDN